MAIFVPDKLLFTIILYAVFLNLLNVIITEVIAALALGLVGLIILPIILTSIINRLGFGAGGVKDRSCGSWFMSLYRGMIERGSLVSVLQSTGAAGLGIPCTLLCSCLGFLIGAFGGAKLAQHFSGMDSERQTLETFILVEEKTFQNNNMVIFTLMPALLYNDVMLKRFVETFTTWSPFANSDLFKLNFKENDLSKLKSEQEKVNHTVYNLLISDYEESRVKYIFRDDYIIGYNLNLSDYKSSNFMTNLLVDVWDYMNGVIKIWILIKFVIRLVMKLININIIIIYIDKARQVGQDVKNFFQDKARQVGQDIKNFFQDKFDNFRFDMF